MNYFILVDSNITCVMYLCLIMLRVYVLIRKII